MGNCFCCSKEDVEGTPDVVADVDVVAAVAPVEKHVRPPDPSVRAKALLVAGSKSGAAALNLNDKLALALALAGGLEDKSVRGGRDRSTRSRRQLQLQQDTPQRKDESTLPGHWRRASVSIPSAAIGSVLGDARRVHSFGLVSTRGQGASGNARNTEEAAAAAIALSKALLFPTSTASSGARLQQKQQLDQRQCQQRLRSQGSNVATEAFPAGIDQTGDRTSGSRLPPRQFRRSLTNTDRTDAPPVTCTAQGERNSGSRVAFQQFQRSLTSTDRVAEPLVFGATTAAVPAAAAAVAAPEITPAENCLPTSNSLPNQPQQQYQQDKVAESQSQAATAPVELGPCSPLTIPDAAVVLGYYLSSPGGHRSPTRPPHSQLPPLLPPPPQPPPPPRRQGSQQLIRKGSSRRIFPQPPALISPQT